MGYLDAIKVHFLNQATGIDRRPPNDKMGTIGELSTRTLAILISGSDITGSTRVMFWASLGKALVASMADLRLLPNGLRKLDKV